MPLPALKRSGLSFGKLSSSRICIGKGGCWVSRSDGLVSGLIFFREVNESKRTPEASTLLSACFLRFCRWNPAVLTPKSVGASRVQISSFTSRKNIRPRYRRVIRTWARGLSEPDRGDRRGCLGGFGLVGVSAGTVEATLGPAGMIAGAVEAALDVVVPSWFAGVKQNSSEAKPLSCEHLVGVTRFELVTSSVSGKRSPPELNARSRVRDCAENNITELPPSGKNIF